MIAARHGNRPRPSAYPAGMANSRDRSTVRTAISTLVPSEARASLDGLKTSNQYLKPQESGSLCGKYHWIATAQRARLASGPKTRKARIPEPAAARQPTEHRSHTAPAVTL